MPASNNGEQNLSSSSMTPSNSCEQSLAPLNTNGKCELTSPLLVADISCKHMSPPLTAININAQISSSMPAGNICEQSLSSFLLFASDSSGQISSPLPDGNFRKQKLSPLSTNNGSQQMMFPRTPGINCKQSEQILSHLTTGNNSEMISSSMIADNNRMQFLSPLTENLSSEQILPLSMADNISELNVFPSSTSNKYGQLATPLSAGNNYDTQSVHADAAINELLRMGSHGLDDTVHGALLEHNNSMVNFICRNCNRECKELSIQCSSCFEHFHPACEALTAHQATIHQLDSNMPFCCSSCTYLLNERENFMHKNDSSDNAIGACTTASHDYSSVLGTRDVSKSKNGNECTDHDAQLKIMQPDITKKSNRQKPKRKL